MAAPNVSEIVTTTIQSRSRKLADNVTNNNALLLRIKESGKVKTVSGGDVILQELEYAQNASYTRYSGYENISLAIGDIASAASFDYKQAACAVQISGLDQLKNSGKEQMIDLLEARISNAERTMMNSIATDCYSDGTADGGRQIGGLKLLVADDPTTGTVGGINRATASNIFWRNQIVDASDESITLSATTMQSFMNILNMRCTRGRDKPDLWLMDNVYYGFFWGSLQAIQRVTDSKMANAGFETLKFGGADVVLDGGYNGGVPASHMYALNTDYIFLRPHKDRNFVPIGGERFATNQDAIVKLIAFAGNMTLSNAFLQGVGHA